jgi:hypothetical protein
MESSAPPPEEPDKGEESPAPRPGGTLLRFKKLTNHLFGIGAKDEPQPSDKDGA